MTLNGEKHSVQNPSLNLATRKRKECNDEFRNG